MANKLLIATPEEVYRFGNSTNPSRVYEELVNKGYIFEEPFTSFMNYYEYPRQFRSPGLYLSINQWNIILGGFCNESESQNKELANMLWIYFHSNWYKDPHVLLTESGKVDLVRKVCTRLEIEPEEVRSTARELKT